jgi:hypothetical protein
MTGVLTGDTRSRSPTTLSRSSTSRRIKEEKILKEKTKEKICMGLRTNSKTICLGQLKV